jgi:hypothetical protein
MFYLWFLDTDNKCFSPHPTCLTIVQLYHVNLVGGNRIKQRMPNVFLCEQIKQGMSNVFLCEQIKQRMPNVFYVNRLNRECLMSFYVNRLNRECLMSFYVNRFLHVCCVYTALLCMQKIVKFTQKYKIIRPLGRTSYRHVYRCGSCSTIV